MSPPIISNQVLELAFFVFNFLILCKALILLHVFFVIKFMIAILFFVFCFFVFFRDMVFHYDYEYVF